MTPRFSSVLAATLALVVAAAPAFAVDNNPNGTTITDAGQLYRLISDAPIGSTATLGVLREGKAQSIKVPIEKPPSR